MYTPQFVIWRHILNNPVIFVGIVSGFDGKQNYV